MELNRRYDQVVSSATAALTDEKRASSKGDGMTLGAVWPSSVCPFSARLG